MQRKTIRRESLKEDKNNAIASKLLGTNLNDINIEKFRTLPSQGQGAQFNLNGKLSKPSLKAISSKFSVEIIFSLNISNQNLNSLAGLEECVNLTILDISNNQISDLSALRSFPKLKLLNASFNSIMSLDPLENSRDLINVNLQANSIKTLIFLNCLKGLGNLRSLYLKSLTGKNMNPVCMENDYRNGVFDIIKSLRRLDGIAKEIKAFPTGEELIDKSKEQGAKDMKVVTTVDYWYTSYYPKNESSTLMKTEKEDQVAKGINSCKEFSSGLEARIKALAGQV